MIGLAIKCAPNANMKQAPAKNAANPNDLYDSVKGDT
jgi:hypothetical protein